MENVVHVSQEAMSNGKSRKSMNARVRVIFLAFVFLLPFTTGPHALDLSFRIYSGSEASLTLNEFFSMLAPGQTTEDGRYSTSSYESSHFSQFADTSFPPISFALTRGLHSEYFQLGLFSELTYFGFSARAPDGMIVQSNGTSVVFSEPLSVRARVLVGKGGLSATYDLPMGASLTARGYIAHQDIKARTIFGNWIMSDSTSDTYPAASLSIDFNAIAGIGESAKFGILYSADRRGDYASVYMSF
jgi:hypothetical protein